MPGGSRRGADDKLILALAAGQTVAEAARTAGVSERTAYRRQEDSDFRARVEAARSDMVERASGALAFGGRTAAATVLKLITSAQSETVKLGAARTMLEFMYRSRELRALSDALERLDRLEALAARLEQTAGKRP